VRLERAADHSPPSSAEVMERVELYLYPPCGPHRAFNGVTLPLNLLDLYGCVYRLMYHFHDNIHSRTVSPKKLS
jgi:hypothetical protein